MASLPIFSSSSSSSFKFSPFKAPLQSKKCKIKLMNFTSKRRKNPGKTLPFVCNSIAFTRFCDSSNWSKNDKRRRIELPRRVEGKNLLTLSTGDVSNHDNNVIECITRSFVYALLCFGIGVCSLAGFPARSALAAVSVGAVNLQKQEKQSNVELKSREHEYSGYTKSLLEKVSRLLSSIEEVRRGNKDLKEVTLVLKDVKAKKEGLQAEIMGTMYKESRELKRGKESLLKRAEEIVDESAKVKGEYESMGANGEKDRMEELKERMQEMEEEYSEMWEKVSEIEDQILRRETMTLSIGVRELCFIERECEELVKNFSQEMKRKLTEGRQKASTSKLSRSEIQQELEAAQKKLLEQMILTNVVEVEDGSGILFNQDSADFSLRIKQGLNDSRKLQEKLESRIRKKMKRYGDEKRFVVKTPEGEVLKGFPEVEMKWMFGDKEVVVPKAIQLHLYHGWKKWREEAKADLKRSLLEDVDFGKQYLSQKQERILLDRDRVVAKTWFSEENNRWEMDSMAVPYAVSKKLVDHARIRHDWGAMYVALKGDDKEYYVDIKEFEMLYEDFGGFDGLYMQLLAQGVPTVVQLMWIPFSELNFRQQFLLTTRVAHQCFNGVWKSKFVSYARDWAFEKFRNINDDIMMMIVFPAVEFVVPYPLRMRLGMAWPEEIDQSVGSTWYLKWQSEAEMSFKSRKRDDLQWLFWFGVRAFIYGYILLHIYRFLKKKVPRLLGFGPFRSRNPNVEKLQRLKAYVRTKIKRIKDKKSAGVDPIRTAFDGMKRVKNPPIPLKDFASIESMREEINEVVAFLRNPSAFQDMGARAPRGVLIVGDRGTGKTSLALAIATEAKVPVVNIEAQQLEAGLWVGQSASNIRELFQTARDLAPVIIFVEDFDLFAGVRGKFIHTKKQDHEAFINQLLVELDGFEKQDGVVLMATTRNIKQVDEALQRPGRMDRIFYLQRPTQAEREKILQIAAKETMDKDVIDFVDWKKVAEKTALLRPIELKLVPVALEGSAFRNKFLDTDELMGYCGWFATFSGIIPKWIRTTKVSKNISRMLVKHLGLELTKEDLQSVVDLMEPYGQISNGVELLNPPLDWTRETKFPHAVWAAGRGLVALLLPNFDIVDNLWLEPFSWQGIGCTKISKARNGDSMNGNSESRSYLEKKLVFFFGSHVAAQLLLPFGEENILSSDELKQAQEIATRMVIQYGWGPDDSPAIYYSGNAVTYLSMGDKHEYEMATKVEKMYDLAYLRAREMLCKNRRVLEKIVEELLEYEILTGRDLERILEANGGIREKEPFSLSTTSYREAISSSFLEGGNGSAPALLGTSKLG